MRWHHQAPCHLVGHARSQVAADQVQAQIYAGGTAGRGEDVARVHVQHVGLYLHPRVAGGQRLRMAPMRGGAPAVEQARRRQHEGAGADGQDACAAGVGLAQRLGQGLGHGRIDAAPAGDDDDGQDSGQGNAEYDAGIGTAGQDDAVVGDAKVQAQVAKLIGDAATNMTPAELGQRFLEPGLYLKNPIDQISLGMALVLGTAGMPHILMRFFTVPTAQDARTSVIWAMAIIGGFYVMTIFLGMGSAINVGPSAILALDKGGNMAAPLLAQFVGGGPESLMGNLFLAFVAAVAFATIVAVVAGLVLASASAMSHDLYVGVIRGNHASAQEQVTAARISTVIIGALAIYVGIAAKGQNVAHLVALAFAVAASSNLPAVFLTLYWKKTNTYGVEYGLGSDGKVLSVSTCVMLG